ncbi:MAG: hypothetical protein JWR60_3867 [Polaromonas sp.]|nr:hypothetical protein [Polaromonas sp.]
MSEPVFLKRLHLNGMLSKAQSFRQRLGFKKKMKVFRHVAACFNKLDITFVALVHLAALMKLLHGTFRTLPSFNLQQIGQLQA